MVLHFNACFLFSMIANVNCAAAASDCEVLSQAATSDNEVILNQNSLPELLYDSFQSNYNALEAGRLGFILLRVKPKTSKTGICSYTC